MSPPGRSRASPRLFLALALLPALGAVPADDPEGAALGVTVEEVAKDSAGERAGILTGDLVVSWSRAAAPPANPRAAQGAIGSPFDLLAVEAEQFPRGPLTLLGRRGHTEMTWSLPPGALGLVTRPALDEGLLARHRAAAELVAARKGAEAAVSWRAAAAEAKARDQGLLAAWFLATAAKALADARLWPEADKAYEEAAREAAAAARPGVEARVLRSWGDLLDDRSDWSRAEDCYQRALRLDEPLGAHSLAYARTLNNLAVMEGRRGNLAVAQEHHLRALQIRNGAAPDSLDVAVSLNNLGTVAWSRGELLAAEEHHRRSLAIRERLAPGSVEVAGSLNNLGLVAAQRGDLAAAEDYFRRSLALKEKLAPASRSVMGSLGNLGILANDRSDLATAEQYHQRALAIKEKLAPESLTTAMTLNNMGNASNRSGDQDTAERLHQRALLIREKLAPQGLDVALSLFNLGEVARHRGDLGQADSHLRRALAIQERLAPGSIAEAGTLDRLGLVSRAAGRLADAAALFLRSVDALESQQRRLGATDEVRAGFGARHADAYHHALETLTELGRPAEAVHVLERSRARSLLALLAERDLMFSGDLPAALARERRLADAEYDRVQARMARLSPAKDEAEINQQLARLRELRQAQEDVASRIRAASPHFASLQYPEPLDLDRIRAALDPGTVLLAYSVGADQTVLLAMQPAGVPGPGLFAFSLPVGESGLREKVEALRAAIQRPGPGSQAALWQQAAELYDLLLRPAEAQLVASQRLLLSPEGPLHSLPFACLVRREAGQAKTSGQYLVEWKPLHVVPSATVYAELQKSRRQGASARGPLVAFGDPRYPAPSHPAPDEMENPQVREVTRSFRLTPLPFTRQEVDDVARRFRGRSRKYLGLEATEARAKALDRNVRYVHFACHGTLDQRSPLNSALALSIPAHPAEGQDNGLLQAWEIFDQVRIDADLVTLSACNTALGKEMGGEGLLGLTRAFLYAGARSVLATLWSVSDSSTPLLMERFYVHLEAGQSRDQALRAAQIDFIRGRASSRRQGTRTLSHPFRWAAYQLSGDWR